MIPLRIDPFSFPESSSSYYRHRRKDKITEAKNPSIHPGAAIRRRFRQKAPRAAAAAFD